MMNFHPRKLTQTETCGRVQRSVIWVGRRSGGRITTLVTITGVMFLVCPPP